MKDHVVEVVKQMYWYLVSFIHPAILIIRKRKPKSLLDVGCGKGDPVRTLKCYKVGLDIDIQALKSCLKKHTHDDVVLADASYLPFRSKSFDAVICLQVLHLIPKTAGQRVIVDIERVAQRIIVFSLPFNEPFEGISSWYPIEFAKKGYTVKFYGLRFLHKLAIRRSGTWISRFIYSIDPLINIFISIIPLQRVKYYMVCHKVLGKAYCSP